MIIRNDSRDISDRRGHFDGHVSSHLPWQYVERTERRRIYEIREA